MGAGRNSTAKNSNVNPYDQNTDPEGYALYALNNAPSGTFASDNPTSTGTKQKASVFDFANLFLNNAAPTIQSIADLKLAQQGIARGTTATDADVRLAEAQAKAELEAQQKVAKDAGGSNNNNNTLYYVGGGLLFLFVFYLIIKASKKP